MSSDDYRWHHDYPRLAFDTGFTFETYRSKSLDKIIGPMNVDHIIRERDVATIEKCIPSIVEFSLDNDQTSVLDPTFVKIFHLSQLSVQYLLFCKKYLDNSIVLIKQEFQKTNEENKDFKRQLEQQSQEVSNYKKQIKELKGKLQTNSSTGVFQCQECPKAFSTEEYLIAHIKRRHESLGVLMATSNASFQSETNKLQLEIKELKERLNNTERFVSHNELMSIRENTPKPNLEQNVAVTELQGKFEHLKTHVDSELKILQTQKFEKEKYEKWFETFLSNKLQATIVPNEKPSTTSIGTQGEIVRNNCSTQTECELNLITARKEDCEKQATSSDSQIQTQMMAGNFQEKLNSETQSRLQKFEEFLEEKVTGSIEKLETRMQSFLGKINDIEEQRSKIQINTPIESLEEVPPKAPKSWKQVISHQNTGTTKLLSPNNKVEEKIVTTAKPVAAARSVAKASVKKFCSSSSESEDSETSGSDSDNDHLPVRLIKPVVTVSATSTLARRSLTSLKEVAFAPEILEQLKNEVEKVMQKRLEEVGVNPKSKNLSVRPYQKALGIVSHQATIIQKNVSNYMQIRKEILKDIDHKISERTKTSKHSKLRNVMKSLVGNNKNKQDLQKVVEKLQVQKPNSNLTDLRKPVGNLSEAQGSPLPTNRLKNTVFRTKPSPRNMVTLHMEKSDSENSVLGNNVVVESVDVKKFLLPQDVTNDEIPRKNVLKFNTGDGLLPKKRVIFDLQNSNIKENITPMAENIIGEVNSSTSLTSSVLDGSKVDIATSFSAKKAKEMYESSDWELSEVSTN